MGLDWTFIEFQCGRLGFSVVGTECLGLVDSSGGCHGCILCCTKYDDEMYYIFATERAVLHASVWHYRAAILQLLALDILPPCPTTNLLVGMHFKSSRSMQRHLRSIAHASNNQWHT
jgi:hypothetical protein